MENTITVPGWRGRLNAGLPPRQLEAVLLAATDKTAKEIARAMTISPDGARQLLDAARFKLGMQRTTRGTVLEAWKRGIIAPLAIALLLGSGHHQPTNPIRRPTAPRSTYQVRVARKVDELAFVS
ncbi:hypothetical protein BVH03_08465 [Pseudomonas sp. PA15(2017)]|uniref:helix-turn-helix transcriptional regulator n=1 Tax=Pseudomonas sp. PA15(2017) TaxID=1932111 RepID=UPI000960EC00|nr:helix-turn-helix transcriptional regulator [Pseudomonas sp. PA15(2017)]OLU31496.1 hypothetical protein BVH03_08465 [Pseudomonas sp. PA15(2017)]